MTPRDTAPVSYYLAGGRTLVAALDFRARQQAFERARDALIARYGAAGIRYHDRLIGFYFEQTPPAADWQPYTLYPKLYVPRPDSPRAFAMRFDMAALRKPDLHRLLRIGQAPAPRLLWIGDSCILACPHGRDGSVFVPPDSLPLSAAEAARRLAREPLPPRAAARQLQLL